MSVGDLYSGDMTRRSQPQSSARQTLILPLTAGRCRSIMYSLRQRPVLCGEGFSIRISSIHTRGGGGGGGARQLTKSFATLYLFPTIWTVKMGGAAGSSCGGSMGTACSGRGSSGEVPSVSSCWAGASPSSFVAGASSLLVVPFTVYLDTFPWSLRTLQ